MYALFFEDSHEPAGVFDTKNQIVLMGRRLSREHERRIVGIFNRSDGTTAVCCKFEAGEQVYDGGGCAPAGYPGVNPTR